MVARKATTPGKSVTVTVEKSGDEWVARARGLPSGRGRGALAAVRDLVERAEMRGKYVAPGRRGT